MDIKPGTICEIAEDNRVILARVTQEQLNNPACIIHEADPDQKAEWFESEADEVVLFHADDIAHQPPFRVSLEVWRGGFRFDFTGLPEWDDESTTNTGLYEED